MRIDQMASATAMPSATSNAVLRAATVRPGRGGLSRSQGVLGGIWAALIGSGSLPWSRAVPLSGGERQFGRAVRLVLPCERVESHGKWTAPQRAGAALRNVRRAVGA